MAIYLEHMNNLKEAAKQYLSKGISVIVTDNNKRSLFSWKDYQSRHITEQEIDTQFSHPKAQGIAIICGKVSGNLEVIDIDLKNDTTGNLYGNITDNIPAELLDKLYVVKTKNNGYHFYYYCDTIEGNQKLATRPSTEEEIKAAPQVLFQTLIETRSEGGYVIAPPSHGYSLVKSDVIPSLTTDERNTLLEICRSFNEVIEEVRQHPKNNNSDISYSIKPWDDYNNKTDAVALLVKHGWKVVRTTSERTYFCRPGKDEGISGDYHHEKKLFKAFTTSSPFDIKYGS